MKITDISSISENSEQTPQENEELHESRKKRTLLQRFDIPIEHLDFSYVATCNDSQEIERILRVLRSGEEGVFPDLEHCVVTRLEKLKPSSRLLRVEIPVLRTNELDIEERDTIKDGLEEWLKEVETKSTEIFTPNCDDLHEEITLNTFSVPIRGTTAQSSSVIQTNKQLADKGGKTGRIKSWEYDKWEKYDVDAELVKLEIADMQTAEWERNEKPKVIQEQKKIEKLMKSTDISDDKPNKRTAKSVVTNASLTSVLSTKVPDREIKHQYQQQNQERTKKESLQMSIENPSYIEEVDDDDEKGVTVNTTAIFKGYGPRKTTVLIEDLNFSM